jgi:hypothetical protein
MYLLQILILYGALDVILDSMGFGPGHWQYCAVNALAITISVVSMIDVRKHKGN